MHIKNEKKEKKEKYFKNIGHTYCMICTNFVFRTGKKHEFNSTEKILFIRPVTKIV